MPDAGTRPGTDPRPGASARPGAGPAPDAGARPGDTNSYEIERKYLLRGMPRLPRGGRVLHIDQGYVPGIRLLERVRRVREGASVTYYRTVKLGSGIRRLEIEETTTAEIFRALWRATACHRIRKRRYVIEDHGTWEIDRFLGFDLVLAEIELTSESQPVHIPDWLAPAVEREVTGDPAYTNAALAR